MLSFSPVLGLLPTLAARALLYAHQRAKNAQDQIESILGNQTEDNWQLALRFWSSEKGQENASKRGPKKIAPRWSWTRPASNVKESKRTYAVRKVPKPWMAKAPDSLSPAVMASVTAETMLPAAAWVRLTLLFPSTDLRTALIRTWRDMTGGCGGLGPTEASGQTSA